MHIELANKLKITFGLQKETKWGAHTWPDK